MQKEIYQQLPTIQKLLIYLKPITIFGVIFTVFGLVFCFVFLKDFDINEIVKMNGELKETKGVITNIYETNLSVNERLILEYEYNYEVNNEKYIWKSYKYETQTQIGDSISVQYNIDAPEYSVIKNYNYFKGGFGLLFVLIFPVVGIAIIIFPFLKGKKHLAIIKNGILTYGTFSHQEATMVQVNDQRVYALFFKYEDKYNKEHIAKVKTHLTHRLRDDEKELIIYNKLDTTKALLVDDLSRPLAKFIKKNWVR